MAVTYKLTQTETAEEIAGKIGCSRAEAKKFLDAAFEVVTDNIKEGYRVEIAGVVIEPKLKAATKKRKGRNPQTGEEVTIKAKPESVVVKARATSKLRAVAPSKAKLKSRL